MYRCSTRAEFTARVAISFICQIQYPSQGIPDQVASDQLVSKTINLCVVKLSKTQSTRFAHGASFS
jgi:hypothetical protein